MADETHEKHGDGSSEGGHAKGHGGGGHGPGGGSHEEAHEGAPEWLISFADNVALMMGFFVILLAMNMAKQTTGGIGGEGKYPSDEENPAMQDFAIAVRTSFNNPVDINSTDPSEASLVKRLKERKLKGETSTPGPDGTSKDNQAVRPSDYVNRAGFILFSDSSAVVTDESKTTLDSVAGTLGGCRWMIEVRGHTSAAEAMHDRDKSMRLAWDRALAAAKPLVEAGLRWEQIRVVACADNERATPLAQDHTGHRNNQRAEIVVTQELVPADPYAETGTPTPAPSEKRH